MKQLLLVLILVVLPLPAPAADTPPASGIAAAHPLATEAGHAVLAAGGNAFDAAVAISAVLAVVEPTGSGLGGGGFWLLHRAQDRLSVLIDGRERAPEAARSDMYLDERGAVVPRLSLDGPLAAAIPGEPAALAHIAEKYGRLTLAKSLAPAIRIAEQGFPVGPRYARFASLRQDALRTSPAAAAVFLDDGFAPEAGFRLRQPALAQALRLLAEKGRDGFYKGVMARRLVAGVRRAGGVWRERDLADYAVIERRPLEMRFGNVQVTTAPPPAGGLVVAQILAILDGFGLADLDALQRTDLIVEAMRLAYRDRARYLGDPAFTRVDAKRLLSPGYVGKLRDEIRNPPAPLPKAARALRAEGANTTHFSVIDTEGNRVAATLSINGPFGSGFMPEGTGVLLNNEMDDFVAKPGVPNLYGLVGTKANAIAPGKRPQSSMSPTFLETDAAVVALGTPGGSRIISMVTLAALDFALGRGDVADWVARPRFHHQYLPDVVEYEPGTFSEQEMAALARLGHNLKPVGRTYGDMQAVIWDREGNRVEAASDPRGEGAAVVK